MVIVSDVAARLRTLQSRENQVMQLPEDLEKSITSMRITIEENNRNQPVRVRNRVSELELDVFQPLCSRSISYLSDKISRENLSHFPCAQGLPRVYPYGGPRRYRRPEHISHVSSEPQRDQS